MRQRTLSHTPALLFTRLRFCNSILKLLHRQFRGKYTREHVCSMLVVFWVCTVFAALITRPNIVLCQGHKIHLSVPAGGVHVVSQIRLPGIGLAPCIYVFSKPEFPTEESRFITRGRETSALRRRIRQVSCTLLQEGEIKPKPSVH